MEYTMKVEGMMCPKCEARTKKALEAVDGVESAVVSHTAGTAVVFGAGFGRASAGSAGGARRGLRKARFPQSLKLLFSWQRRTSSAVRPRLTSLIFSR